MHERTQESSRGKGEAERPLDPGERKALLEALALGLEEALMGVAVLDHGLVLDEGVTADLAAVDAAGRLVVVQLADPNPDRASLAVLELVAWVREHGAVLARHLDSPALRADQAPRTIVVLTEAIDVLRRRLSSLEGAGVELFGLRTIQSASGDRVYLSGLTVPGSAATTAQDPAEAFVGALPADLRDLGRHAVDRIERLDEELEALSGKDSIAWRFRGESLVRLERAGDRLRATLGPEHEVRPLRGHDDVEELLEGALSRLVPLFSRCEENGGGLDAVVGRDRPLMGGSSVYPRGLPARDEPLLTPEEIEAFRE